MSAYPNQPPNHGLEPFIVDAQVLRPGTIPPEPEKKKLTSDTIVRWLEAILIVIPFSAAALPMAGLGVFLGFEALTRSPGTFLVILPAILGFFGIYGLWSLVFRSDEALLRDPVVRKITTWCVGAGVITDFILLAYFGTIAPYMTLILLAPVAVSTHRMIRLFLLKSKSDAKAIS